MTATMPTIRRSGRSHGWHAAVLAAALAFTVAPSAQAQKKGRVITVDEITITGRVQKPIASVDVTRIQPRLTLAELRQSFITRIEDAVTRVPF